MTRGRGWIRGVGAAAALSLAAGCNIVGPAFVLVHGPEKVPAAHTLEPGRPTVVLIDDRASHVPRRALRAAMAAEAERVLLKERALTDMISGQSALAAASVERDGRPLPITEVGRAVGAEVVIYATVDEFTLSPDGQTFVPTARLRVKVIDAVNDRRLWPEDRAGYTLLSRVPPKQGTAPTTLSEQARAEDELAKQAGLDLARLFFKHERPKGVQVPE
jgi:type IV secretory pathway protease TraF